MHLPKIAIWSLFRDDAGAHINRYIRRVNSLKYPADCLRFYVAEGDSTDDTLAELQAWAINDERVTVISQDTSIPRQYHTTRPERFRCLAQTGNAAIDAIAADGWADYCLMLESDLIIPKTLVGDLLAARPDDAGAVAPMVWIGETPRFTRFYDIWAFRDSGGVMFPPHNPGWYDAHRPKAPYPVNSAGSVLLIDAELIYDGVRYPERDVVVGMCREIRQRGKQVYCLPSVHIKHPAHTTEDLRQQWRRL